MKKKNKAKEKIELQEEPEFLAPFLVGDVIINESRTVIGVYVDECVNENLNDDGTRDRWPLFSMAFVKGKFIENFDDAECFDWPREYNIATDDEEEAFFTEVERVTGKTWEKSSQSFKENDDTYWPSKGSKKIITSWKQLKQLEKEGDVEEIDSLEDLAGTAGGLIPLGKLRILHDRYMKDTPIEIGDQVYTIVPNPNKNTDQDFIIRSYIYGARSSLLTFKYQEQARCFATYFEDLILEAYDFLFYDPF